MPGHQTTPEKRTALVPYVLGLLTILVFSQTLGHDFINYDDPVFVTDNPLVIAGLTWEGLIWAFTTGHQGNWIPLTWLSHMLDVQIFGIQSAAGHHGVNLILHTCSTLLLYRFLHHATKAPWKSASVAALFALHPLHVESVAWIAERKDVLSTFFLMLALNSYLCYTRTASWGRYLLTLLLFLFGLLSKSMLVSMPILLILLDYWPLKRQSPPLRLLIIEKIPFILLASVAAIATFIAHNSLGAISETFTLSARAGKAAIAYLTYIGKMAWPTDLAVIYTFSLYPPQHATVLASILGLVSITAFAVILRRNHPYLVTGWLWYIFSLAPVCGVIQIGMHSVADRYTYIPLIGLFLMISWGVPDIARSIQLSPRLVMVVTIILFAIMSVLTIRQVSHWRNSLTLFQHTVAATENNWIARAGLGLALFNIGREEEAIQQYLEAIKAKPSYVFAHLNLGYAYFKRGNLQLAIDAYQKVIQREPDNPVAHLNLGYLYLNTGNKDAALAEYKALQGVNPEYAAELLRGFNNRYLQGNGQETLPLKQQ